MSATGLFKPGEYASMPKALLAEPSHTVSPAAKVVYIGLASYLNTSTTQAWPGPAALRKKTGLSRRAIQKAINKLAAAGWIRKASGSGPDGTNLYTLYARRTDCASADDAPPLAHEMPQGSAKDAPKVLDGSTQGKYSRKARRKAAAPDPRVREFIDWFSGEYQTAQGKSYILTGGKDGATVKRLLQSLPPDDLKQAVKNMLADDWGKDRASIGLLASQINTWRGGPAQALRKKAHDYSSGF